MEKYRKKITKFIGLYFIGLFSLLGSIIFSAFIFSGIDQITGSRPDISLTNNRLAAVPAEKNFYDTAIEFANRSKNEKQAAIGLIAPHHLLAADLIAGIYSAVANAPESVVVIGPNHFNSGDHDILTASAGWDTPYGLIEADTVAVDKLTRELGVSTDTAALAGEHAITGQAAFIKRFFPNAKILPIVLKSTTPESETVALAEWMHENLPPDKTLVIASLDFSHDQRLVQTQQNDATSLKIINANDRGSLSKVNVDSRGALDVMMRYNELAGASFNLLNNTNSAELAGHPEQPNITSYITGLYAREQMRTGLPAVSSDEIRLLFFGDMMLDRHVGEKIDKYGLGYIFEKIEKSEPEFFNDYDIVGANLEGAVTDKGAHYKPDNAYDFAFDPELIKALKKYNFTYFNIANNHLADQGENGIIETRNNLSDLGFTYSGCRDAEAGTCSTASTTIAGKKVALLGFSQVYRALDQAKILEIVRSADSTSDLAIVNMHWGAEYEHQFSKSQQELGRKLIDAGADMVIGHHPHVVQGMEVYKNKPIFYSLGNFIFDQYFSPDTQEELGVGITAAADRLDIKLFPLKSQASQPALKNNDESRTFIDKFIAWSELDEDQKKELKISQSITINNFQTNE